MLTGWGEKFPYALFTFFALFTVIHAHDWLTPMLKCTSIEQDLGSLRHMTEITIWWWWGWPINNHGWWRRLSTDDKSHIVPVVMLATVRAKTQLGFLGWEGGWVGSPGTPHMRPVKHHFSSHQFNSWPHMPQSLNSGRLFKVFGILSSPSLR